MRYRRGILLATAPVALALCVAGCGGSVTDDTRVASPTSIGAAVELPSDALPAGAVAIPFSGEGVISEERALVTVDAEYGRRYQGGSVDAFLVTLTDPGAQIQDRPVWLVRYSGLSIPYSGPMTAEGAPAEGGFVEFAYVVLDAFTAEWLYTEETG